MTKRPITHITTFIIRRFLCNCTEWLGPDFRLSHLWPHALRAAIGFDVMKKMPVDIWGLEALVFQLVSLVVALEGIGGAKRDSHGSSWPP